MRLLILLLLLGCGPELPRYAPQSSEVAPELVPLFNEWLETMYANEIDVSRLAIDHKIHYVDQIDLGLAGLCVRYHNSWEIWVSKRKSVVLDRLILWHELGHCALTMRHWETSPADIMYWLLPMNSNVWTELWPEAKSRYLDEAKFMTRRHED